MTSRTVHTFVKAALAAALLTYLVAVVEVEALVSAAASAQPGWILAAGGLLPINMLLEGAVWWLLATRVDREATLGTAYGSLLSGYAVGLFTPGRVGEYAGRVFYLSHPDKWSLSVLVFLQHMFDLVVSTALGLLALLFVLSARATELGTVGWIAFGYGVAALGTLLPLLLLPARAHRFLTALLPFAHVRRHLAFLPDLTPQLAVIALTLSAVRYGVYTAQMLCLLAALGAAPPWQTPLLGTVLTFFASFLIPSLTFMGLGIREGTAVYVFGLLGLPEAAALGAALLLFGINFVLPAVAGVPFLFKLKLAGTSLPAPHESA
jgi:uncharacterized membrane protein YbhN (UPF0104 family)